MLAQPPRMAPPPVPIALSKLLLVEGDTPMHFFEALLKHLGLDATVEVRNFRGLGDFRSYLIRLAATTEFRHVVSLGVIRDAEDKPAVDARQSVTDAFTAAGLTGTPTPLVKTAAFILPDGVNPGMIETLCMEAVRAGGGAGGRVRLCRRVLPLPGRKEDRVAWPTEAGEEPRRGLSRHTSGTPDVSGRRGLPLLLALEQPNLRPAQAIPN